jgi:hypothetical protein
LLLIFDKQRHGIPGLSRIDIDPEPRKFAMDSRCRGMTKPADMALLALAFMPTAYFPEGNGSHFLSVRYSRRPGKWPSRGWRAMGDMRGGDRAWEAWFRETLINAGYVAPAKAGAQ